MQDRIRSLLTPSRRRRRRSRWAALAMLGLGSALAAVVAIPALSSTDTPAEAEPSQLSCPAGDPWMEGHITWGLRVTDDGQQFLDGVGQRSATKAFELTLAEQYPSAPLAEFKRRELSATEVAFMHPQGYVIAERRGGQWVPAEIGYCQSTGRAWTEGA